VDFAFLSRSELEALFDAEEGPDDLMQALLEELDVDVAGGFRRASPNCATLAQ
jgi:hypothetical protein